MQTIPADSPAGSRSRQAPRRALVTGASGFIGSWLVRHLVERGCEVVALVPGDDPDSELFRSGVIEAVTRVDGRLEEPEVVDRAVAHPGIDTVFHLGAQTIVGQAMKDPYTTFESNIRGTYSLLEACRRHVDTVRCVVVASSDKAYGDLQKPPYVEEMALAGRHPYDVSKSCTDLLATSYAVTYRLPVVTARLCNVYGGGDFQWSRIVPGTIRSLLAGERPVIRSDGTLTRDYLHVDDAVEAYLALANAVGNRPSTGDTGETVCGQAFNIGCGKPCSALDVVNRLRVLMDREHLEPMIENEAAAEIPHQSLDWSKARRLLGWEPEVGFDDGLRRTVEWYSEFLRPEASGRRT